MEIGAVNTIVRKNGKLYGYNTDVYGMQYLAELIRDAIADKCGHYLSVVKTAKAEGMTITAAAMAAAKARLRPILMTALTMIFGMLPLMFATGVGANGNISIGVGTVGGMLIGTLALLIVVPPLFIIFQHIEEKVMPKREKK